METARTRSDRQNKGKKRRLLENRKVQKRDGERKMAELEGRGDIFVGVYRRDEGDWSTWVETRNLGKWLFPSRVYSQPSWLVA